MSNNKIVSLNARGGAKERPQAPASGAGAQDAAPVAVARSGVFVTPESLTFPAATAVTTTLLKLLGTQVADADTNFWYALLVSSLVGGVIIFLGLPSETSSKQKFIAVGILNILLLTASVLGLSSLAAQDAVTADSPK